MDLGIKKWLIENISKWLTHEHKHKGAPLCDYEKISYEIRQCDVLLIEGRSRVSEVIKTITQSNWTHSALYIGRLHDIVDEEIREHILKYYDCDPNDQLILEAMLGQGTIIRPLSIYKKDHIRICRPKGLSGADSQKVISFVCKRLGTDYDVRQLLDLARFMFPYSLLPRRWRSSLFQRNAGMQTQTVCSSLIAGAFASVQFPILPVIERLENGKMKLYRRNFRLYTPSDFDYSPYFDIIKYPYLGLEDMGIYRQLPWDKDGIVCNDNDDCFIPEGQTYQEMLKRRSTDNENSQPNQDNNKEQSNTVLEEMKSAVHLDLLKSGSGKS